MVSVLSVERITDDVRGLAAAVVASPANFEDVVLRGALADAVEEAGGDAGLAECVRAKCVWFPVYLRAVVEGLAAGSDVSDNYRTIATAIEMRVKHEAERSCLRNVGVVGNPFTMKGLCGRITRTRPRGSGGKVALARRLGEAMDELAARRWARVKKGQRRPGAKAVAAALVSIGQALHDVQHGSRERLLRPFDVCRAAALANRAGRGEVDGGVVTAGSYRYPWSTTDARAMRQPDGTILVTVSRRGGQTQRGLVYSARGWAALWESVAEAVANG